MAENESSGFSRRRLFQTGATAAGALVGAPRATARVIGTFIEDATADVTVPTETAAILPSVIQSGRAYKALYAIGQDGYFLPRPYKQQ